VLYVFFIYYTCTYIHIEIYEDMYITVGVCMHKYTAGFFFCLKKLFSSNARGSEIFSRLDCKVLKVSRPELAQRSAATQANYILLPK